MNIKANSTVDKIYCAWYRSKYGESPPEYVNLCPYLRAVMFWALPRSLFIDSKGWLRVLSFGIAGGIIESLGWALTINSFMSFPEDGAMKFLLEALILIFAVTWTVLHATFLIIGTAFAVGKFFGQYKGWFSRSAPAKFIDEIASLVKKKASAAHQGICPMVRRGAK